MKQKCIERICNLTNAFNQGDISFDTLLRESQFQLFYKEIKTGDIIKDLQIYPDLVDDWKRYSDDKGTSGGFYYRSKHIGSVEDKTFDKTFNSDIEACSEYILKEISFWLHINHE